MQSTVVGFKLSVPSLEDRVFPAGTTILLAGRPGVGKSAFAQQLITEGLECGQHAILVLTDTSADAVRKRTMEKTTTGRLEVIDFLREKPRAINEVSITIHQDIANFSGAAVRVVVDSLSTLGTLFNPGVLPPWVLDQRSRILKHNSNVVAVMIYGTGIHPPSVTRNLQALSDVVLEMKTDESTGELRRLFRVFSARGAPHSAKWYPFTIDDSGIHFEQLP